MKYSGGVMVVDSGAGVDIARVLVPYFDKVYYYSEWKQGGFPKSRNYQVGVGIPGVESVMNMDEWVLKNIIAKENDQEPPISLFIFTDCYNGDKQVLLEHLGFNVFGSRYGEELELDREGLKDLLKHVGLPVGPYKVLKGLDAVSEHLKANDDQFVKLSRYRGDAETFHADNFKDRENYLDSLKTDLGVLKNELNFICEDALPDCVETGVDLQVVDGKYPSIVQSGLEVKDCGYASVVKPYKELPKEITVVTDKLSPVFEHFGYKGNFSNEIRIGKDKKPYLMDMTCRQAMPVTFTQLYAYENIAEIFMETAKGNVVDPKPRNKFFCEMIIKSEWAEKNEQYVEIPKGFEENFFFKNYTIINGEMYVLPHAIGMCEIGSVVAGGETIEEAFEEVQSIGKELKGSELHIPFDKIDTMRKEIELMSKFGINIFE